MATNAGDEQSALAEITGMPTGDPVQTTDADSIHFKVNGEELTQPPGEDLTAEDILRMAKEKGALVGGIDQYTLEGLGGEEKYAPGDKVTPKADEQFLAVPSGPTPVA